MKRMVLTLIMFLVVVPACFADSNLPDFNTKIYLVDANSGGPVTAATTEVTVFAKFKADVGVGVNSLSLSAFINALNIVDFNGTVIMDASLPLKPVPVLNMQGYPGLGGDGETIIRFGNIRLLNPQGKIIHPYHGIIVNAYIEFDPESGGNLYTLSRASTVIDFNNLNLLVDKK